MANQINTADQVIDSRDVIERIEELEDVLEAAHEQETTDGLTNLDFDEWLDAVIKDQSAAHAHEYWDEAIELRNLKALAEECEGVPDWTYGAQLIREDYFTDYIKDLIDDCYEMPKEINSGRWPYNHITIDYESAADEAKVDYTDVTFDGETYFVRAV